MSDIFRQVRERVPAKEAARYYGLTFDRQGLKALCPYHGDTHPSMSFRNGRFRCFACQASGDSIDLVQKLFGLSAIEAVRRLNEDFKLLLPIDRPPTAAEREASRKHQEQLEQRKARAAWREDMLHQVNSALYTANQAMKRGGGWSDQEITAMCMRDTLEYYENALSSDSDDVQAQIYRDRRDIETWLKTVWKS